MPEKSLKQLERKRDQLKARLAKESEAVKTTRGHLAAVQGQLKDARAAAKK